MSAAADGPSRLAQFGQTVKYAHGREPSYG
jgi:hypothetical protein